ncbi:MAG: hypothetical protein JW860_00985 [Sedimentisphaerales bacterium]|nr:hypothetical protein [Sedimentisphaerales bacterium]
MAKLFYSSEEVQERLSITEEQIQKLVETAKLREFLDGAKKMYKVDEVDNFDLAALTDIESMASDDDIPLADSGEISFVPPEPPIESADDVLDITPTDTGSSIGLAPMDSGSVMGMLDSSADQISLEDTAQSQENDDTVITTHGTVALDDASGTRPAISIDPLAQIQMGPDELGDQVPLDSGGSGSGLLDLSREADDTSLGAELLEEIYPSADEGAVETQLPTQMDIPSAEAVKGPEIAMEPETAVMVEVPRAVQLYDAYSGVYGAMMIVPFIILIYLAFVSTSALVGLQPPLLASMTGIKVWYVMGGAAALAGLILMVGFFMVGQSGKPREPKAKKQPKPKKAKGKKGKK